MRNIWTDRQHQTSWETPGIRLKHVQFTFFFLLLFLAIDALGNKINSRHKTTPCKVLHWVQDDLSLRKGPNYFQWHRATGRFCLLQWHDRPWKLSQKWNTLMLSPKKGRRASRDKCKKETMLGLFCCLLKEHCNISGMFRKAQEPWGFLLWALSSREGAGELVPSSLDNSSVNRLVLTPPYLGFSCN